MFSCVIQWLFNRCFHCNCSASIGNYLFSSLNFNWPFEIRFCFSFSCLIRNSNLIDFLLFLVFVIAIDFRNLFLSPPYVSVCFDLVSCHWIRYSFTYAPALNSWPVYDIFFSFDWIKSEFKQSDKRFFFCFGFFSHMVWFANDLFRFCLFWSQNEIETTR